MIIEFNAFKNCTSLKEIHFEKLDEPVNTDIYNCNVPDDLKIIVKDKLYKQFLDTEIPANHYRITLYSEYLQEKLQKIKNYNIILSIIYIQNVIDLALEQQLSVALQLIINILKKQFNITDEIISYVNYKLNQIKEYQNE